jgi:hypothetical protein
VGSDTSTSRARTHARTRRPRQYPATGWGSRALVHGIARHSAPPDSAFLIFLNRGRLGRGMGRRSASARGVPSSSRTKIARRVGTRDAGPAGWMDGYVVSALATHHPLVCCLEEPNAVATSAELQRGVGARPRTPCASSRSASGSPYCRSTAGQRAAMNGGMRVGAEPSERGCMHWRRAWWRAGAARLRG